MKQTQLFATLFKIPGRHLARRIYCNRTLFPARRKIVLQESPLAGFQYHRAPAVWPFLQVGESLHLKREPSNPHDRHAIAVWFKNEHLGYVPKRENRTLAQLLDQGERLEATIIRLLDDDNPWRKIRYQITWIGERSSEWVL
ncbi:MAG: HIRAN domain-containing protein [Candidatus Thiodiazotropha sp. DIVDIV]